MLRLAKGNGSSLSLSMMKGGSWLLLSTSDNEADIVLTWPFRGWGGGGARDEDEFQISSSNIAIPGVQPVTQVTTVTQGKLPGINILHDHPSPNRFFVQTWLHFKRSAGEIIKHRDIFTRSEFTCKH